MTDGVGTGRARTRRAATPTARGERGGGERGVAARGDGESAAAPALGATPSVLGREQVEQDRHQVAGLVRCRRRCPVSSLTHTPTAAASEARERRRSGAHGRDAEAGAVDSPDGGVDLGARARRRRRPSCPWAAANAYHAMRRPVGDERVGMVVGRRRRRGPRCDAQHVAAVARRGLRAAPRATAWRSATCGAAHRAAVAGDHDAGAATRAR